MKSLLLSNSCHRIIKVHFLCLPTACDTADIVIMLDSSGSITETDPDNWDRVKTYVNTVANAYSVNGVNHQFSIVNFARKAKMEFPLNQYTTKTGLLGAINAVSQKGSTTNSSGALAVARLEALIESNGNRPTVPNICLFIGDGVSLLDTDKTAANANALKLICEVFVLFVENENAANASAIEAELELIASGPSYMRRVPDFVDLPDAVDILNGAGCDITDDQVVATTQPPEPTTAGQCWCFVEHPKIIDKCRHSNPTKEALIYQSILIAPPYYHIISLQKV